MAVKSVALKMFKKKEGGILFMEIKFDGAILHSNQ
jgi:hypothetical protein